MILREFILNHNTTGLVTNSSGTITVLGGENSTLAKPVLSGQLEIFAGSGTTQSTYVYPSATIAAWESFIATATPAFATGGGSGSESTVSPSPTGTGGALRTGFSWLVVVVTSLLIPALMV